LAQAAQQSGVAMVSDRCGQRLMIRPWPRPSRSGPPPDILLLANLGAVQLNYGYGIDHCRRAVDLVQADALVLHLNALQEALQPEGDANSPACLSASRKCAPRSPCR
jgi:isopentenyl-diphosphate delta-isomerase